MVRIRHDDWSTGLGENISDQTLEYMAAMLLSGSTSMGNQNEGD